MLESHKGPLQFWIRFQLKLISKLPCFESLWIFLSLVIDILVHICSRCLQIKPALLYRADRRNGTAVDSISRSTPFESRMKYLLTWLRCLSSLVHPGKYQNITSISPWRILPNPFQFILYLSHCRSRHNHDTDNTKFDALVFLSDLNKPHKCVNSEGVPVYLSLHKFDLRNMTPDLDSICCCGPY